MLLDRAQNRVVALDKDEGAVVAIDLDTGVRTALSDASTHAEVPLMMPQAMAMDPATGRLLVLDQGLGALLAVDLETGDRTMLSDNATGTGPEIGFAFGVRSRHRRGGEIRAGSRDPERDRSGQSGHGHDT